MSHHSRLSKVVIDVRPAEHDRELAFWSTAVGQQLTKGDRYPEYHGAALHGQEFGLLIQRLGDGPARVHLDIRSATAAHRAPAPQRMLRVAFWCYRSAVLIVTGSVKARWRPCVPVQGRA